MFKYLLVNFAALATIQIVLWHGIGDSAEGSMVSVEDRLKGWFAGVYIYSIRIGDTQEKDRMASYFDLIDRQVKINLKLDPGSLRDIKKRSKSKKRL